MSLTDQRHTVRLPLPDLIVRGRDHVVYAPVYLDGALVAPTQATSTVSVYDASGTAVVSAATVTVTNSIARYTITAATTTSLTLGERWRVEWVLTLSSGAVLRPRNDAALVRNGLWPVVGDVDLFRLCPALDPSGSAPISASADYQDQLDEAWTQINLALIAKGNRPNLIMEPSALRQSHLYLTLSLIFEGLLQSRLDEAYRQQGMDYRRQYEAAWSSVSPRYDVGDSGAADLRRRAMNPSVWLSSRNGGIA